VRSPAFALEPLRPNPARGALDVTFALTASGPARLALVDLGGRVVAVQEVGALGPGRHVVRLADARGLAPGLYWVRLTSGAQRRTVRVTVIE